MTTTEGVLQEDVVQVLDKGFLALDGALATDLAVVNGARVSFNSEAQQMDDRDAGLIRFLMRERHGSPFVVSGEVADVAGHASSSLSVAR